MTRSGARLALLQRVAAATLPLPTPALAQFGGAEPSVPPVTSASWQLGDVALHSLITFKSRGALYCAAEFSDGPEGAVAHRIHATTTSRSPLVEVSFGGCEEGRDALARDLNGITAVSLSDGVIRRRLGVRAFPEPLRAALLDYACGPGTPVAFEQLVNRTGSPVASWIRGLGAASGIKIGHAGSRSAAPADGQHLWSVKTRGEKVRHAFIFESRSGDCTSDVRLRELVIDYAFLASDAAKVPFPRERLDPVPEPTPVPSELQSLTDRIARVEVAVPGEAGSELRYCSGLLLDEATVLTARHCVAPALGASCLEEPAACAGYSVDIGFVKSESSLPRFRIALPVEHARGLRFGDPASSDFVFLGLTRVAAGEGLPLLPSVRRAPLTGASTFLLSHPFGHFAVYSPCELLFTKAGFQFHDCYACAGASGAPLWAVDWSASTAEPAFFPIGIHTRGLRSCVADRWADDVNRELKHRLGHRRGTCSGRAVSVQKIFCDYCVRSSEPDLTICENLAELLPGDAPPCDSMQNNGLLPR